MLVILVALHTLYSFRNDLYYLEQSALFKPTAEKRNRWKNFHIWYPAWVDFHFYNLRKAQSGKLINEKAYLSFTFYIQLKSTFTFYIQLEHPAPLPPPPCRLCSSLSLAWIDGSHPSFKLDCLGYIWIKLGNADLNWIIFKTSFSLAIAASAASFCTSSCSSLKIKGFNISFKNSSEQEHSSESLWIRYTGWFF